MHTYIYTYWYKKYPSHIVLSVHAHMCIFVCVRICVHTITGKSTSDIETILKENQKFHPQLGWYFFQICVCIYVDMYVYKCKCVRIVVTTTNVNLIHIFVPMCLYVFVCSVNSQEVMYNSLFRDEDVQSWNDTSVVLDKFLDKVRSCVCIYIYMWMYIRWYVEIYIY